MHYGLNTKENHILAPRISSSLVFSTKNFTACHPFDFLVHAELIFVRSETRIAFLCMCVHIQFSKISFQNNYLYPPVYQCIFRTYTEN